MGAKSVAIVTGSSQGIGRATALRVAYDFSAVALVAREQDKLEETATEIRSIGTEVMVIGLDLREPQSAETIIEGPLQRFGRIDALLNFAGAVPQIDLFRLTDTQRDDGMALKFHGARRLTIQAWDALKSSHGSVVLMSGNAALDPKPGDAAVAAMQPSTHSQRHSQNKEEIADLMSYLVSPAAKWMTGASACMDGGEIKGI